MQIDFERGRVVGVRQVDSPNFDQRPPGAEIDLVVIHGISLPPGRFGGPFVEALFTNQLDPGAHPYFATIATLRVSCHLFIDRDGQLVQFVPLRQRAWHAGDSSLSGREDCNSHSIGIELEGTDTLPYTDAQYASLVLVLRALRETFPGITPDRIVGHSDVSPERKSDPGPAFDWRRLRGELMKAEGAGSTQS